MELINELLNLLEKDTPGLALGAFKLDTDKGKILTNIGGKTYEFTPLEKNVAELYNSVTGVAKHSPGKALVYLKQHAKGVPIAEAIEREGYFLPKDQDQSPRGKIKVGAKVKANGKYGKVIRFDGDEVSVLHPGDQKPKRYDISEVILEGIEISEDIDDQTSFNNLGKFEVAITKYAILNKIKSWSTTIVSGHQVYHIRNKYFAVWDPEKKRGIIDPDFKGKSFELIDQLKK